MQKFAIIAAALVAVALSYVEAKGNAPKTASWEDFKNYHGKMYVSDEHEANHKATFQKNAAAIAAHNQAFAQGKVSYTKELNAFSDIEPATFRTRNGFKAPIGPLPPTRRSLRSIEKRSLPASFDWRTTGKVSPVKDQGQCGSCWSFSSTGALESQVLIKNSVNRSLSEQQLVSCDKGNGDYGCNGGMYTTAWNYLIKTSKGIESGAAYPYASSNGGVPACQFASSKIVQKMTSFTDISGSTDDQLMTALVNHGPVSVAIDAQDMQSMSDGIYSCGSVTLDHAVLLVGYGTLNGKPYWIVKNSWGTGWGEKGFFKLARGSGDCGITQWPAYPIL